MIRTEIIIGEGTIQFGYKTYRHKETKVFPAITIKELPSCGIKSGVVIPEEVKALPFNLIELKIKNMEGLMVLKELIADCEMILKSSSTSNSTGVNNDV